MSKNIQKILQDLADSITREGYVIEGLELSYVDTKEHHLEVFTYSTSIYEKAFQEGFKKIGSLLLCEDTFKKTTGEVLYDSKFRNISDKCLKKGESKRLDFKNFSTDFSVSYSITNPTYSKWISHYRKSNINGVFFFYGKRKLSNFDLVLFGVVDGDDKRKLTKYIRSILNKFTIDLNDFSMVFERLRESRKDIIEQATRAAISQVMARNTSHNIGAHVMNKLVGDLSQLNFDSFKNYKSEIKLYKDHSDNNKKILDQISIFNNYVKCRMDYLADISFGTPLMETNKYAYADLFQELDKVRLLLEHISGLDAWTFEIEFLKNGKPLNIDNDLLVAIPNDILGTQAFYNILENIIRNSAKHSDKSKLPEVENVIFTVNFIDDISGSADYCDNEECDRITCAKAHRKEIENVLNEFIVVEVYDNIPVYGPSKSLGKDDITEFKRMMGNKEPQFKNYIDNLVFNQNKQLNKDILQENKLRSYSLGLVEMDASAAYLRKRPVEYINHPSYDIQYDESWSRDTEKNKEEGRDPKNHRGTNCRHFLKAFKKTIQVDKEEKNYLGYRFFLHRPAVVLVATQLLNDDNEKKEKLKKEGIWLIEPKDFEKDLKEGKVYSHEFVVYTTEESNQVELLVNEYKTSLPIRTLEFTKSELDHLLIEQNLDSNKLLDVWEGFCWEKWYAELKIIYGIYGDILINTSFECDTVDNNFNAVLLDHKQQAWTNFNTCINVDYLDGVSSIAQDKIPGRKKHRALYSDFEKNFIPNLYKLKTERNKLRESVRSKILVIDERVQNQNNMICFHEIKLHEVYNKLGIIIPESANKTPYFEENISDISKTKFNLSANNIDNNYGNSLINYIKHYVNGLKRTDFILIHYSILERVFEKTNNKTTAINDFLNEVSGENNPQIVITSGRGGGALKELTSKVRFVNLSSIVSSFVDIKSKYYSNYLLHSSRKNNDKS